MRIVLTRRYNAQLALHLAYGVERFGEASAEQAFRRIDILIFRELASSPKSGRFHPERDFFNRAVPKTPFVIYYRYDERRDVLTMLAIFNDRQNHETF
jgi:plasmid stabilization system protein ParE